MVKNALLVVLVHPVSDEWHADVSANLSWKKSPRIWEWEEREGAKLKKQITPIVYSALHSEGEDRKKIGILIKKIFQEQNTNEQILKCYKDLLSLSDQPAS